MAKIAAICTECWKDLYGGDKILQGTKNGRSEVFCLNCAEKYQIPGTIHTLLLRM